MSESVDTKDWSVTEKQAVRVARDKILERMIAEERVEASSVDSALLARLLGYLKPHRKHAAAAFALAVLEAFIVTLPAYVIGIALDRIGGTHRVPNALDRIIDRIGTALVGAPDTADTHGRWVVFLGLLLGALWMLRSFFAVASTYIVQMLGQRVVHDLRRDVYRHITSMDLGYFQRNPIGRLVNRATFDVQALSELFSDALAEGLRDILFVIVMLAVMLALDPVLGLIVLGAFPFLVLTGYLYRKYGRPALRTQSAVQSRMNAWLAENIAGMRENHLYGRTDARLAEFRGLTEAHQTATTHLVRSWALVRPMMMLFTGVASTLVLILGYQRVTSGILSLGVLLTFLQYTMRLWVPIRNLTEKMTVIQTSLTSYERIADVLDEKAQMFDLESADPSLAVERGTIEFAGVEFTYPGKTEPVLRGVSFSVERGKMLALVGDTGAGKTTIVQLLSRFYDVSDGAVKVDGHDVREFTLSQLRSGIALVPQDVVIFAGSVRDNVTLGKSVDDATLWRCLDAVRAGDIIRQLDGALDHELEEGGRTLSTGQRQLLSFARALVYNPPVLVLDEATANVDTKTEAAIQEALSALTAGRTSVVIAHRLSTIREADEILVLRHGAVVERGSHDVLLAKGGEYARLHRTHLGGTSAG